MAYGPRLIKHVGKFPVFFLLGIAGVFRLSAEVLIPADNANINYYGRVDFSIPAQPAFNWSGTTIEAAFSGPSIGVSLTDGNCNYDIEIDGVRGSAVITQSGVTHYTFATGLSNSAHTVRMVQRTENHWNKNIFKGFYLADGNTLLTPPVKPLRKIEFVGDSHLAGYGVESPDQSCTQPEYRTFSNANEGYGRLVSRAFHAQDILLGWSGAGMVRNYGDTAKKSAQPFPYHYGQTLGEAGGVWDFARYIPDLVVIALGTNDFSTTPYPDDTMYVNGYHKFITTVLGHYPGAEILCVSSHTGRTDPLIAQVVAAETTSLGHPNIHYGAFPTGLSWTGCDWHPSVQDQALIAKALIGPIMKMTGWDTSSTAVSFNPIMSTPEFRLGLPVMTASVVTFHASFMSGGEYRFRIMDLRGRVIFSSGEAVRAGEARQIRWNSAGMGSGMYVAVIAMHGMKMPVKFVLSR